MFETVSNTIVRKVVSSRHLISGEHYLRIVALWNSGRPNSTNIDGAVCHSVVNNPISSLKPAMSPEPSAPCSRRVHVWKVLQVLEMSQDFIAIALRQLVKHFPNRICPDDPVFHRFLSLRTFARDRCTTSSCAITRPALISASERAIIPWKSAPASMRSSRSRSKDARQNVRHSIRFSAEFGRPAANCALNAQLGGSQRQTRHPCLSK